MNSQLERVALFNVTVKKTKLTYRIYYKYKLDKIWLCIITFKSYVTLFFRNVTC